MPSMIVFDDEEDFVPSRRLAWGRRFWLLCVAAALASVFALAAWIRPYDAQGNALRKRTHTQLGMTPCTFEEISGKPCPSCGMTTSFSLLIHGDPVNSARANWVGTLLAVWGLLVLPTATFSALTGRPPWAMLHERWVLLILGGLAVLALLRWAAIMLLPC